MSILNSRAHNSHIETDIILYSQLTLGRLLSSDDSPLGLSDQLPLGLGQAQGAQREQHKALHNDKWGVWGAVCLIYFPLSPWVDIFSNAKQFRGRCEHW